MGRNNPSSFIPCPAKHTVEYNGEKGRFRCYDSDKKEEVLLDLPLRFVWVEELTTIVGWNDELEASIHANEVKKLKEEPLTVFVFEKDKDGKAKRKVLAEGLYADIKPTITTKSFGGQYAKAIYGVADGDNGCIKDGEIVRIILKGIGVKAWIDKGFSAYDGGVAVYETTSGRKGKIKFEIPVFQQEQISGDLNAKACKADKEVQAWLDQEESTGKDNSPPDESDDIPPDEYEDDIPF